MKRIVLAVAAAVALSACTPASSVDPNDPWKALEPWNHARPDVQKVEGGTEYVVVTKGEGKLPSPGESDLVEVNYEGRLAETGVVFDSSSPGEPIKFRLNRVIPGWTKGIQKMQPGDTFVFWIPAAEAYGANGRPPQIPPNSDLMFKVELLKSVADPWKKVSPWPTDSSEVVRRPSGLEYIVVESGPADGPSPTDADQVLVNFESRNEGAPAEPGETADDVRNRNLVLSTYDEGRPKSFPVKGLIPGWAEAVKLMRRGDRWIIRMPAELAYKDEGDGRIPPGGTVIWELELLDFGSASPTGPMPQ